MSSIRFSVNLRISILNPFSSILFFFFGQGNTHRKSNSTRLVRNIVDIDGFRCGDSTKEPPNP